MKEKDQNKGNYRDYVTVSDASAILGVSIDTVRRWEKSGKLHAKRLDGKNRYFAVEDLHTHKSMQPLSSSEVALLLNISTSTVRRLENQGQLIPTRNDHGKRLYNQSDVEAYMDAKTRFSSIQQQPAVVFAEATHGETVRSRDIKVSSVPPQPNNPTARQSGKVRSIHNSGFHFVQRVVVYTVSVGLLLISLFSILLLITPGSMTRLFWIDNTNQNGSSKGLVSRVFQPFANRALNVVDVVSPGTREKVQPVTTGDISELYTKDENGNITTSAGFSPPSSSYLKIPDSNLVVNLNSEYVQGQKPGESAGDLALLPITSSHIKDGTITSDDIAAGVIQLNNLSPEVLAYLGSGQQQTIVQPVQQFSGINGIVAGIGLNGGGSSGTPTINVQTGLSTEIISNAVEVKLGTSALPTTSSVSGLEISSAGLGLLGGCSAGQLLKWDGSSWICSSDVAGGGSFDVQEGGSTVTSPVSAINFNSNDFSVSDVIGQANVAIDYTNSAIVRRNQNESITGTWSFNNVSFSSITGGQWQGSAIGTQYGGTGINSSAASNGQLLIGNGSGLSLANLTAGSGVSITNGAGAITIAAFLGTSIGNSEIDTNAVTLGAQTVGNFVGNFGALTGLTTTGNSGEGSTPTLAVTYGSAANTAVQGNTQLTCAAGNGNLTGGGNVITLGTGGACNAISTNSAVGFGTSVTTPSVTNAGALALSATGGGSNLTLSADGSIVLSGFNCTTFTNGGVLTTNASGVLACGNDDGGAGGSMSGLGTTNYIPLYTGTTSLGNSYLAQNGSTLELDSTRSLSLLGGNLNVTGAGTFSGAVSALSFSGSGANLTALDAGNIAAGTLSDARLSTNVTVVGNTFNGIGQLVQLNGSGELPALNGSLITNVNATNLGGQAGSYYLNAANLTGSLSDARLSVNVTVAGNTFNGNSQLVRTTVGGLYPALDGSLITNINAATLGSQNSAYYLDIGNATGTLNIARLADSSVTNAKLQNSTVTVTAGNGLGNGGAVSLGGSVSLAVLYGTTSNTAVQGNTQLTCASGTGNLSGGGTIVTLGNGGTCADITTAAAVNFGTSVTTPLLTNTGSLSISTTGVGNDLTFSSADQIVFAGFDCSTFDNGGVLTVNASGEVVCDNDDGGAAGTITGSGTTNFIPLYTGSQSLGSSYLSQNGSDIEVASTRNFELLGGNITVNGSVSATSLSGSGANITAINAGNINTGTLDNARLSNSVTLAGNTFNGISQLVQTTAGGLLPILDGSQLTNINAVTLGGQGSSYYLEAANLTGNLNDARLSNNVTLAGNTFNGNSQLVQTTAGGLLPALDGSLVTSVNAAILGGQNGAYYLDLANATGTLAVARIADGSLTNTKLQNSSINTNFGTNLSGDASVALGGILAVNMSATPSFTTVTATTFNGALTGNSSTASALAANPTDCAVNQFATAIAANGNLTCAALTDADIPDVLTIGSTSTVADGALSSNVSLLGSSIGLASAEVSGVLAVGNGGTGLSSVTTGDLLVGGAANTLARLASVASGSCLISNGIGTSPVWGSCAAGGGITGNGTQNSLAMFTSTGVLGDSTLAQNGSTLEVAATNDLSILGGNLSVTGNANVSGTINGANITGGTISGGSVTGGSLTATGVNGLNVSGGIISSGTWQGTAVGAQYGGTGLNTSASTGIATVTGGTWSVVASLTDGQINNDLTISASGSVADGALSSNVTLLGNTFNGNSQLVQTTAGGLLPALDGSLVSDVDAVSLSGQAGSYYLDLSNATGTLDVARIANGTIGNGKLTNSSLNTNFGTNLSGSASVALGGTLNVSISATPTFTSVIATTFSGDLTGNVVGSLTGNAATATALAANPTDCVANQFANAIAANGNLSCAALTDGDIPDMLTVGAASSVADGALSANVTLAGNTFNGISQLVQTTVGGLLPALDGSLITNVNAGQLGGQSGAYYLDLGNATGTLGVARIADTTITNAKLQNSSIATSFGTNLSGSASVALGGTLSVDISATPTFTSVSATTFSGALTGNASTASALAANPTDCAANQFANAIAANGNLTCASITDADVSNTLTASIFIGSGSTTNAIDLATAEIAGILGDANVSDTLTASLFVGSGSTTTSIDLATAEVAGNLRASNLQSAATDLGAADVNINLSNTNGAFNTNLTLDGIITATTFSGALTGNASTASALAANPTDCAANQFANAIAANGNLTCAAITDADVADTLTASIFIGSGSTTNAIDLATAEVAGILGSSNISGSYTGITGTGALGAGSITANFGGIDVGADSITTTGTIGTAGSTTFTGAGATFSGIVAANSASGITSTQTTLIINATGTVDIQDTLNVNNITTDTGGVSIAAGQAYTGAGAVTLSSGGSAALTLTSASGTIALGSSILQRSAAGTTTIDLLNAGANTTFAVTNSDGTRTASLSVEAGGSFGGNLTVTAGGITVTGNSTLTGTLTGLTGLTVASGGASISGGLNNNSGGITNAGAVSGATTITASGNINTTGVYQNSGVSGISLDCAANQFFGNSTSNGGIITAATCENDDTGFSDSLLKTNISSVGSKINTIKNLNVVDFNFRCLDVGILGISLDCADHTGILAQEIALIFPELIDTNHSSGFMRVREKSLMYYGLAATAEMANLLDGDGAVNFGTVSTGGTTRLTSGGALQNIASISGSGALTVSSGGSSDLTLNSASNTLAVHSSDTVLQRNAGGSFTVDLNDLLATTLVVTNSGVGTANINIAEGALQTGGTVRLTNAGVLQNITGLTVTSGGAIISGGIDNNSGGITEAGAVSGITGLSSAGSVTFDLYDLLSTTGLTISNSSLTAVANLNLGDGSLQTNGTTRLTNAGALQNITGLTISSGGASISGGLNNNNGGITNAGSIAGATTVSASGLINSTVGYQHNGTTGATVSCAGNNFLGTQVVRGGIIISGTCEVDSTGLSDARLKENIVQVDTVLDALKDINIVKYDFKCLEYADLSLSCDRQTGVIAQELELIFPELVTTGEDGYKRINFEALNFYNLKAVTEIAKMIDSSRNAHFGALSVDGVIEADTLRISHIEGLDYEERLDDLDTRVGLLEAGGTTGSIDLENLEVGSLTVSLDLLLGGGLTVAGHAQFNGTAFFDKLVTFGDSLMVEGNLAVLGTASFNNSAGGYAVIAGGQQTVHVTFARAYDQPPVVVVSLGGGKFARYSHSNVTAAGFDIVIDAPAAEDLQFSWTATSITNPLTAVQN